MTVDGAPDMAVAVRQAAAFGRVASSYERARPGYPAECIDWLQERLGLRPGRTVLDLAAGTGKLTRLLVPTGATVLAVEPLAGMRAELVAAVPGVEAHAGTAEMIPLPDASVDAVTVAQAFHWFDVKKAGPEIARVLRPGGHLAIVWNLQDKLDPLVAALEQLSARAWGGQKSYPAGDGTWEGPLRATGLFGPLDQRRFPWVNELSKDDLVEQFGSTSGIAALGPEDRVAYMEEARAVMAAYPDPVEQHYTTHAYVCQRK